MKNKVNKILSMLLTAALALGVFAALPNTAFAVDIGTTADISPALAGRAASPTNPASSPQVSSPILTDSTIAWFGGYQWVIIGWDGDGVASKADTATLLYAVSNSHKPTSSFSMSNNNYTSSNLRTAMNNTATFPAITDKERNAIAPQSLTGNSGNFSYFENQNIAVSSFNSAAGSTNETQYINGYYINNTNTFDWYAYDSLRRDGTIGSAAYTGDYNPDNIAGSGTTEGNFWPLSVAEASLLDNTIRTYSAYWWLRSPGDDGHLAADVSSPGTVYASGNNVFLPYAVRPAFNLDLSSVILTSAASGGTSKPAAASSSLSAAQPPTGVPLKFTVRDDYDASTNPTGLSLSTTVTTLAAQSGGAVSVPYTGAQIGTGRSVSVVIADNTTGKPLFYGRPVDCSAGNASDTATFNLPSAVDLAPGSYKLLIFNEEVNGPNLTDYASTPVSISLTVDNTGPALLAGAVNRTSDSTATVKFTSNEVGTYYYQLDGVAPVGANALVSSGTSGTMASGENTISLTSLAAGPHTIYIAAKDAAGNVSNMLTIIIPAYVPTLTVSAGAGGSVSGTPNGNYTQGMSISVTATPNSGYSFSSWTASGITVSNTPSVNFNMPANNVTLTANFIWNGGTYNGGDSSSVSSLRIVGNPRVTHLSGASAKLGVTATGGYTPYTYQWQRKGSWIDIPGATSAEFTWDGLTTGQAYTVRCVVKDRLGTTVISPELTFIAGEGLSAFPVKGEITSKNVNVRPEPNTKGKRIARLQMSDEVSILGYTAPKGYPNGFYKIAWDNGLGYAYISADYVSVTFGTPPNASVLGRMYLQSRMNTAKKYRVATLAKGDTAKLLGRYKTWWFVEWQGEMVYMKNGKYVQP